MIKLKNNQLKKLKDKKKKNQKHIRFGEHTCQTHELVT
jgi:hypothetical protein